MLMGTANVELRDDKTIWERLSTGGPQSKLGDSGGSWARCAPRIERSSGLGFLQVKSPAEWSR